MIQYRKNMQKFLKKQKSQKQLSFLFPHSKYKYTFTTINSETYKIINKKNGTYPNT